MSWQALKECHPDRLSEARTQLHWALQPAAAALDTEFDRWEDDGQSNFGLADGVLVSRALPNGDRLELDLKTASYIFGSHRLELTGRSLEDVLHWVWSFFPDAELRDYAMPDHPVSQGQTFVIDEARLAYAAWCEFCWDALSRIAETFPGSTAVRCWPHHFDLGALLTLDGHQIGIGMSPRHDDFERPYFYVNPYGGRTERLPRVRFGRWHTSGFLGIVLEADELFGGSESEAFELAWSFLGLAINTARQAFE